MLRDAHYRGKAHGPDSSCLSHPAQISSVASAGVKGRKADGVGDVAQARVICKVGFVYKINFVEQIRNREDGDMHFMSVLGFCFVVEFLLPRKDAINVESSSL